MIEALRAVLRLRCFLLLLPCSMTCSFERGTPARNRVGRTPFLSGSSSPAGTDPIFT
jgi:hypothetical protein